VKPGFDSAQNPVEDPIDERNNEVCDIGSHMKRLIDSLFAVALCGLCLLCGEATVAAPMRCSGEQKTCLAACNKSQDRSSISTCLTNCGFRQSLCMKTGCWDTGLQKYCGLLKQ
jgi:hypothetical protein